MKHARITFGLAAIYGLLVTVPLFFSEQKFGIDYPPPITHAEYFYAFAGVTFVWQILFIFIAINPKKYRPIMLFCVFEKLSLLPGFIIMFPQGRYPALWIPLIIIDLAFGVSFFIAYLKTKETQVEHVSA
jgi:hypothetical protein